MDKRHAQRVLRSNVPSELCFDFSSGLDCTTGSKSHVCSRHHLDDRPACVTNASVSDTNSERSDGSIISAPSPRFRDSVQPYDRSSAFRGLPRYSAEAAIRRDGRGEWPLPTAEFCQELNELTFDPIEWNSPKYRTYRQRQKNPNKKDKANPWPDHIEYAFQKALRKFGGRGRKKEELGVGGKLSGGNEWILWCIWVQTGEILGRGNKGRKQVSSHLQVLKGKMHDNPEWLKLAKPWENRASSRRERQSRAETSGYLGQSMTHDTLEQIPAATQTSIMPSGVPQSPSVHSASFGMYLIDQTERSIHHKYTVLQSECPSAPRDFLDIEEWRLKFPSLQLYDENRAQMPTFLFEAGISPKEEYVPQTQVSIALDLQIVHSTGYHEWTTRTQVGDAHGVYDGYGARFPQVIQMDRFVRLHGVFMAAEFWADLFHRNVKAKQATKLSGNADHIRSEDANARRFLDSVQLHQQIWATPQGSGNSRCIATLLWKFHYTAKDIAPTTSWRPLFLTKADLFDSSNSKLLQPDSALNTTGQPRLHSYAVENLHVAGRLDPYNLEDILRDSQDQRLFAEQPLPSIESSPATEMTIDAGSSILSSTSYSFPSSLSSSVSLTRSSQQSSFESYYMNGVCGSFGSGTRQESQASFGSHPMPAQYKKGLVTSQGSLTYDTMDNIAMSQDQYIGDLAQLPDFRPFDIGYDLQQGENLVPLSEQDFVGGDIQITYAEGNDSTVEDNHGLQSGLHFEQQKEGSPTDAYESPLMAPQPQMTGKPHSHILQLQHFDYLQHGVVKGPSEERADLGTGDSCITVPNTDEGKEPPGIVIDEPQLKKEDSVPTTHAIAWDPSSQPDLHVPSDSHLAAYVSPFIDPPGTENFEQELQEWQCIEAEKCLTHVSNGSDTLAGASLE